MRKSRGSLAELCWSLAPLGADIGSRRFDGNHPESSTYTPWCACHPEAKNSRNAAAILVAALGAEGGRIKLAETMCELPKTEAAPALTVSEENWTAIARYSTRSVELSKYV